MASRTLLQMDQATFENKKFHGNLDECGADPNLDRPLCLPVSGLPEIPEPPQTLFFAYPTENTGKSLRASGFIDPLLPLPSKNTM